MKKTEKGKHGGSREGSGNKSGSIRTDDPKLPFSSRIKKSDKDFIQEHTTIAKFLNWAVEEFRKKHEGKKEI